MTLGVLVTAAWLSSKPFCDHVKTFDPLAKGLAGGTTERPSRRRACVDHVMAELGISERRACRVLGQHRSTQRKVATTTKPQINTIEGFATPFPRTASFMLE